MSAQVTIEVILRSSDSQDGIEERRFTLRPNEKMPVGRASKNTAKPELMMAPDNAFIDSPVISREHAVLSADTAPPTPSVYITDSGSMHGTMLNGSKLEPRQRQKLSNGDVLQFGADVTRNDNFFIARKYTFHSSLLDDYSHGFTVPDVETSDDEDIEVDDLLSSPACYGTQTNPVTIDVDSEDAPPAVLHQVIEIEDETVLQPEPAVESEDTEDAALPSPQESHIEFEEPSQNADGSASGKYAFADDASSEEGDEQSIYSSDGEESQNESNMSQDGSDNNSDAEVPSDSEDADENKDEEAEAVRRMKMGVMLNHEQLKAMDHNKIPTPAVHDLSNPPTVHILHRQEFQPLFNTAAHPVPKTSLKAPEPEMQVPAMDAYINPIGLFDDAFSNHVFANMDSPLPPRPTAPKPSQWGVSPYSTPYAQRDAFRMFSEESQAPNLFLPTHDCGTDFYDRYSGPAGPDTFQPKGYPPQAVPQSISDNPWATFKPSPPTEAPVPTAIINGVQTPPAPSSEASSPPQPRRTKVSIPEIVENTQQQPPTPTSVTGSLKRKADVLEEEIAEAVSDASPLLSAGAQPASEATPRVETTSTSSPSIQERPKKRLRARLSSAAKNIAAYIIPGVAITVGILTQVPEGFYKE